MSDNVNFMDYWDEGMDALTGLDIVSGADDDPDFINQAFKWLQGDTGRAVATIAGGGLAALYGGSKPDPTGYQGTIPNYTYTRTPIQHEYDPNRRPGSGGRRYFTEGSYSGGDGNGGMPASTVTPTPTPTPTPVSPEPDMPHEDQQNANNQFAQGGLASLGGKYLRGETDGMADAVPASIEGKEPAALSDGEFVIPADVVSHLGNGNSEAGAKVLQQMLSRIRKERTGNDKQGKQINPNQMIPR